MMPGETEGKKMLVIKKIRFPDCQVLAGDEIETALKHGMAVYSIEGKTILASKKDVKFLAGLVEIKRVRQ